MLNRHNFIDISMKIKNIGIVALFASFLAISACRSVNAPWKHYLTVINQCRDFCSPPESGYYRSGETIKFKTDKIYDASLYVILNDTYLTENDYEHDYLDYSFEMPDHDATLVFTMDSFYLDKDYTIIGVTSSYDEPINIITSKDIVEIKETKIPYEVYKSRRYGDNLNFPVTASTDKRDLDYNYDVLHNEPIVKAEDYAPTINTVVSEFTLTFKFFDGENFDFSFAVYDGVYIRQSSTNRYFKLKNGESVGPKIQYSSENQ